jgi:hypothetical protein
MSDFPRQDKLTEHLERLYRMPDTRPCNHIWEGDDHGSQRCVRCGEPQLGLHAGAD